MNVLILTLVAWLFLGLEQGLKDALSLSTLGMSPSFVFVLLAFIAMSAPKSTTFWCAAALGVAMDLLFKLPMREGTGVITLVGPHALAYALGCQLIISMRALMMRRNPLTLAFLAFVGSLVAFLVLDAIYTLRHAAGAPIAPSPQRPVSLRSVSL